MPDMPMAQDPDMHMAQDPDDDDGTFTNVDKYFNEHGYDDEFLGLLLKNPILQKTIAI